MPNDVVSSINLRVLAACTAFASKDEARYYLNGVCIEIDARGVTYAATDGARLIAYRDELNTEAEDNLLIGTFIIPTEHCKHFKVGKDDDGIAKVFSGARLTIAYNMVDLTFAPIDGVYPDWRKVIPRNPPSGVVGQFNLKVLTDLQKLAKGLDLGTPFIAHDGEGPARVWFPAREDVVGVVMPYRVPDQTARLVPDWAKYGPDRDQADIEDAQPAAAA